MPSDAQYHILHRQDSSPLRAAEPPDAGLIVGMYGKGTDRPALPPTRFATRCPTPGELVRYAGESHLMTFGVTGSGKTSGPVIANALDHGGPLISIECKGDVYAATSEHRRQMGQQIVLLDLRQPNPRSGGYNPLDGYLRTAADIAMTARSAAADIVPNDPNESLFWTNWSSTMLTGGLIHLLTQVAPEERNFATLFNLFHNDDVNYNLALLLDQQGGDMHPAAYKTFASYLQLSERETRPSVLASTQQHLRLWESDYVRALTARTSFNLDGLIAGEAISLYIIVPAFRMKAYAPLLRIWLSSLLGALMTREKSAQSKRTLILCDELGALGKIESFVTASTLLRSANVQLWSFWQNPAQLEIYGSDARTLVDNAGVLQFLGAKNFRLAAEFAGLIAGTSADEIMNLGVDEQLVLIDGGKPQTLKRVRYFEHPLLRDLAVAAL